MNTHYLNYPLLALVALGLLPVVHPAFAQTWTQTSAPITNWTSVASSADGAKLVAAPGSAHPFGSDGPPGPIYISTDSGATWTAATAPTTNWISVASSADGTKLVAAAASEDSPVYTSTNSGATWMPSIGISMYGWSSVASSADGTKLLLAARNGCYQTCGGPILTSTNAGATWTATRAPGAPWSSVAAAADRTTLVAASSGGPIYTSTNAGASWTPNGTPSLNWCSVASSADGSKLVAVANGGGIWTSQSTPVPLLSITPSGTNLVLSWIVPSMDFLLQQNSDLTTTNWMEVTNTPTLNLTNLQNQVTLSSPVGNRFYRLKSP